MVESAVVAVVSLSHLVSRSSCDAPLRSPRSLVLQYLQMDPLLYTIDDSDVDDVDDDDSGTMLMELIVC